MKKNLIPPIFKILLLYEDVNNSESNITEKDYLKYLDRLYIRYCGFANQEICQTIKGLHSLGVKIEHDSVKATVFHLIDLINKGVSDSGI